LDLALGGLHVEVVDAVEREVFDFLEVVVVGAEGFKLVFAAVETAAYRLRQRLLFIS